ncbi:MAG TPA: hypothetical protein VN873_03520 [Candidatus Angelobacter sp.]|nr:hypothetical protein [Candidatus Angelobacter sp.]
MAKMIADTRLAPSVHLTPVEINELNDGTVLISQLIAYAQNNGFTRLRLTGGRMLDVKETTDRIDFLVRRACGSD